MLPASGRPAIAKLHGGSLLLSDNHPGLRAQMLIERGAASVAEAIAPKEEAAAPHARAASGG
jgi:hypothetical protein